MSELKTTERNISEHQQESTERFPLNTVQGWMESLIRKQGDVETALHSPEVTSYLPYSEAMELVLPSQTLGWQERIDIYRGMYALRMVEAMEADYPVLRCYTGARFEHIVMAYVAMYPSRSYTLNHLGQNFPHFLLQSEQGDDKDFLYELALAELAISQVIDEEELPVLTAEEVATIQPDEWESLILQPVKTLRLLELRTNVADFLRAVDEEAELPSLHREDSYLMVYRVDYTTQYATLSALEFRLLQKILAGHPLMTALNTMTVEYSDAIEELQAKVFQYFESWIQRGIFLSLSGVSSESGSS